MHYVTKGTCSRAIDFDVVDGKVTNTKFTMGAWETHRVSYQYHLHP